MDGWKNETSIFNTTHKKRDIFVQKKKKKKKKKEKKKINIHNISYRSIRYLI